MRLQKRGSRWKVKVYEPARASKKRYVGTFATETRRTPGSRQNSRWHPDAAAEATKPCEAGRMGG